MRKKIVKDGNSQKIRFTTSDMELYDLKIGDIIDLEFVKVKGDKKGG